MNRRGLAVAVAVAALFAGCGQVVLVDPDADAKADLQLAAAEHLVVPDDPRVYLHVRFSTDTSTEGTALTALTSKGSFALPWSAAQRSDCGADRRCVAFTLGGGLPAPTRIALDAPALSHRSQVEVRRHSLQAYVLSADSRARNTRARIDVLDPIRRHFSDPGQVGTGTVTRARPFLRTFEGHVAPGGCGAPPDPTDPGWRALATLPDELPARFATEPEPLACVWVRPAAPAQGPAVASRTIEVRAEVTRFRHLYVPPIERAPIVFVPLFDLEIPNPARCEEAEGLVLSAVLAASTEISERTGVSVLPLAPEEIAEVDGVACRQAAQRFFDADEIVQRVDEAIDLAFGDQVQVRVVWLYAQNLDLALPSLLEQSFAQLRARLRSLTRHRDLLFSISPPRVQEQLQSERHLTWLATEEPAFRAAIGAVLRDLWPFSTVQHDTSTIISLVPEGEATRFEAYRLCFSSGRVTAEGERIEDTESFVPGPNGPAFRVVLPTQFLLPFSGVTSPAVRVDWEGCEGWCDRAAPGATPSQSWLRASGC